MVGVLALQGDFREHAEILRRIGVPVHEVRQPQHLADVDRLIIPGGESTTIGKLLLISGLFEPIRERAGRDLAVWGTCAGAILIAHEIRDGLREGQPHLDLMNIAVRRNAYGSQLESFETLLPIATLGDAPMLGIFIRAPIIETAGPEVEVLGTLPEQPESIVVARQGRCLASTFHPELTNDDRMHRLFLEL